MKYLIKQVLETKSGFTELSSKDLKEIELTEKEIKHINMIMNDSSNCSECVDIIIKLEGLINGD